MWERNRPTFWQQFSDKQNDKHRERQKKEEEGNQRVRNILDVDSHATSVLPPYGLGKMRTLQEYEEMIGIQMKTKQFTSLSGIMGVMSNAPAQEILCKFGTWKNFESARQILTKELKQ
jgi:hypothetical protein